MKKTDDQIQTCTWIFTAALFTVVERWTQPKCPSTEEWINKMRCLHTRDVRDGKLCGHWKVWSAGLAPATTRRKREDTSLSERSQSQETTHYTTPFLWTVQNRQVYGDRRQVSGRPRLGRWSGRGGQRLRGFPLSWWEACWCGLWIL